MKIRYQQNLRGNYAYGFNLNKISWLDKWEAVKPWLIFIGFLAFWFAGSELGALL